MTPSTRLFDSFILFSLHTLISDLTPLLIHTAFFKPHSSSFTLDISKLEGTRRQKRHHGVLSHITHDICNPSQAGEALLEGRKRCLARSTGQSPTSEGRLVGQSILQRRLGRLRTVSPMTWTNVHNYPVPLACSAPREAPSVSRTYVEFFSTSNPQTENAYASTDGTLTQLSDLGLEVVHLGLGESVGDLAERVGEECLTKSGMCQSGRSIVTSLSSSSSSYTAGIGETYGAAAASILGAHQLGNWASMAWRRRLLA